MSLGDGRYFEMSKRSPRRRFVALGSILIAGTLLAILSDLAGNAASSAPHWPGWLDLIRRHPFSSLGLLAVAVVALAVVDWAAHRNDPVPASSQQLIDVEDRIREQIDRTIESDEWLNKIPPYAAELIREAGDDRATIRRIVAPFADDNNDPYALAREWAASPPPALEVLPAVGHLAVAETLIAYGQAKAGVRQLTKAVDLGVYDRSAWLTHAAQVAADLASDAEPAADVLLEQAQSIDPQYPLLRAVIATHAADWEDVEATLTGWLPVARWERDSRTTLLANALLQQERPDDAIREMWAIATDTANGGLVLQLAQLLNARSARGTGDSRWKDAFSAIELSIRARNLRRTWRGDSAAAVATAAESAVLADDPAQVWTITRMPPDGEATPTEAHDPRVLPLAALGAALTGHVRQANEMASSEPDGYVRRRIEAETASLAGDDRDRSDARAAWMRVYEASTSDEEKLVSLRGLAMEGATNDAALSDMRSRYPVAVDDIETSFEVMSIEGPDTDARLRQWEHVTPLASIRRAQILRQENPQAAADLLSDATERWNDPRLLLMALDCYVDAGEWEKADPLAQRVLAEAGTLWPGRMTVLRRMLVVENGLQDWSRLAKTCRALLEIDQNDEDARWGLAYAQFRIGEPQDAWLTLNRPQQISVTKSTPQRAVLFLELARRFSEAAPLAIIALQILDAYPDDQEVHAAVIVAVTMRVDRTDLPDQIGAEFTSAWASFQQRYPDSTTIETHTLRDDDHPLADVEPRLRSEAIAYHEAIELIKAEILPIGLLQRVVARPYSSIFVHRPLGYHPASSIGAQDLAIEGGIAQSAQTTPCFIDSSALYTLSLISEVAPTLLAMTYRPSITDSALNDLVAAEDMVSAPISGTILFDVNAEQVVAIPIDPDTNQLQQTQIRAMLAVARSLRRVIHPSLVQLASLDQLREPVWMLNLDAAKSSDSVIWIDDLGLRRFAHSLGIGTFGTWSLLSLAASTGRVTNEQLRDAKQRLIREYVVDLPPDSAALLSVAAEDNWEPRGVATALSRAATWVDIEAALQVFKSAFRQAAEESLPTWAYAALHGLNEASPPDRRIEVLAGLISAVLGGGWTLPAHASSMVKAVAALVPEHADEIVQKALATVWNYMAKAFGTHAATMVFLHVISKLDTEYRQYAVSLILRRQRDGQA